MRYALVLDLDNTVTVVVGPTVVTVGDRTWDLRDGLPADAADAGWAEVVATPRPADTATDTWTHSVTVVNGTPTDTWTARPWTTDELAARTAAANEQTLRDGIAAEIASLKTNIANLKTNVTDVTNPTINGSPASYIKDVARAVRSADRSIIRLAKLIGGLTADTDLGAT